MIMNCILFSHEYQMCLAAFFANNSKSDPIDKIPWKWIFMFFKKIILGNRKNIDDLCPRILHLTNFLKICIYYPKFSSKNWSFSLLFMQQLFIKKSETVRCSSIQDMSRNVVYMLTMNKYSFIKSSYFIIYT